MPKFMVAASYNAEGIKAVSSGGGTARRQAVDAAVKSVGGSLECFYFAFGDVDVYAVVDLPDNVTAAALGLAVGGSGAVNSKSVVLMTPEEMDAAAKKQVSYRAPGA